MVAETMHRLTSDEIMRLSSHTRPFPLPAHMTPRGPGSLALIDDDALLDAPPQLIAHIQRTAAQGGMQVISPRQCPFSALMNKPSKVTRDLGDHVVGSVASPHGVWPTLEDDDLSMLLPDEPLPCPGQTPAPREKTRTEPLTSANHLLSDPILACLVKGRAVIDVLSRPDVSGGAEEVATLLASAWGIDRRDLMEMDAFTIGYEGPLLRHAIQADEVYPTTYAPIHQRLSITVGASEVTRQSLPEDAAMDWRRMRVFCEAVFLMSTSLEGFPLKMIRARPPPGDPMAPLNRSGTLAFRPAPCVAWSFEARSFALCPVGDMRPKPAREIPKEVMKALTKYTDAARPVSYAMAKGHRLATRTTAITDVTHAPDETLSSIYSRIARTLVTSSARGRTAAATVRNCMYEALDAAPIAMRLRIARYMSIARDECKAHLQTEIVPDRMIDRLAARFLAIGGHVRLRVIGEAARRGASVEEWWTDILAQAPNRYSAFNEGTGGWARVAMWLAFRGPTDKWDRLVKATKYSALRKADLESLGGIALPAEKGTCERLLAAARHVAGAVTRSYAGYYQGVADVAMSLADEMTDLKRPRSSDIMKEAAYLWTLRSRTFRGTNINPLAFDEPLASQFHRRVLATPVDLAIVPAPYRAFKSYITHALSSPVVSNDAKAVLREVRPGKLSEAFRKMARPIAVIKETTTTRYLLRPWELASDMERAWEELTGDIKAVVKNYGAPLEPVKAVSTLPVPAIIDELVGFEIPWNKPSTESGMDYYETLCDLPQDTVDCIEETLDEMPEEVAEMIRERRYSRAGELVAAVREAQDMVVDLVVAPTETVH